MHPLRFCLALIVCAAAAGCAARPFDRHFEAGRYAEAASIFAADSALHRDERALYRAATLHAIPGSATYDPERARELLHRMLMLKPDGDHAAAARRLLAFVDEIRRLDATATRLRQQVDSIAARLAEVEQDRNSLQDMLSRERQQVDLLRTLAQRLETDLRTTEARLRIMRDDLERLKEIDLQRLRAGSHNPAAPAGSVPPDSTAGTRPPQDTTMPGPAGDAGP